ncbi:GyrI-like domain-containing protein [Niabella beijingensis]|uniref:GyrI-like domain-containing protein n=1 Tax=Niabella beijingensis TaxID=2872700 RepID=UPI001CBC48A5|nr:GyrI-like domain-containing protein [Niabella beijingensis]MBZ4188561.1 GyrI-like domain-containing protein [Niabella beijingensis]
MEKLDLTKEYPHYYKAKPEPALVTIEAAQFLSVTGKGDPSGSDFKMHIEALYPTVYTLKFASKANGRDFVVSKLEGLWWFDEERFDVRTASEAAQKVPRSEWEYRLLIRLPGFITAAEVAMAREAVLRKKNNTLVPEVELFQMEEGRCVQLLHQGPFATEPESLEKISRFMEAHQLRRNGVHHEIYLSDFNKTASEKLRTILREPVK